MAETKRKPAGQPVAGTRAPRAETSQHRQGDEALGNTALSSLQEPIVVVDRKGNVLVTNQAWHEFAEEHRPRLERIVPQANCLEVWRQLAKEGDLQAERLQAGVGGILAGRQSSFRMDYETASSQGPHWHSLSVVPLSRPQGGAVLTFTDLTRCRLAEQEVREHITSQKHAESELSKREFLFQQLAQSIDQVFWFAQIHSERVLYVSPAFERLWGRKAEELYRNPRLWLQTIHPDDQARICSLFEKWLEGKASDFCVEYRIVRPDGSIRWIYDAGVQILNARGEPSHFSGVAKDITERKEAEHKLEKALADITQLKERLLQENIYLQEELKSVIGFDEIVGQSAAMQEMLAKVKKVATTDVPVLLLGETGTGKELMARAIHEHSPRRNLVKVDCAALPSSLIESELFGHVKGAFTSAHSNRVGRFQLADGGTLFLDEIGELGLDLQTKLLRMLEEGVFEPVGSTATVKVDVRVIAATNRDLRQAMDEGTFRPDLYYRLSVFPIEIEPLRNRREDIPQLVWHFITKHQDRLGKKFETVAATSMNMLMSYHWPGNVRELENVIERAMILSPGPSLELENSFDQATEPAAPPSPKPLDRSQIVAVLEQCGWKIKGRGNAAERLGLKPSTLRYRMKKLGITRPQAG